MSRGHLNNQILKKIWVGLAIQEPDLIELFASVDRNVSRSKINSWMRGPQNKNYENMPDEALDDLFIALENYTSAGDLMQWIVMHITNFDNQLLLALDEWARLKRSQASRS